MLAQESVSWAGALAVAAFVGLLMVGTGFVIIGIANRAAGGNLVKNQVAGIRTKATLSSDEAWLAAHQAGRYWTVVAGWLSIAAGIVPMLVGVAMATFDVGTANNFVIIWVALLMTGVVALMAAVIVGAVQGNRAAKAIHDSNPLA